MRTKCVFSFHEWNGCRCVRCGKTRDDGHEWNGCRCALCGKTRDDGHKWVASSKNCVVCGKEAREITIDDKRLFFDAVKRGNVKKVSASLKDHPILIFGWSPGDAPLHVAVREGKVEMTKFLLANGADVHAENNDGAMPLHVARNQTAAKLLLASGADINAKTKNLDGDTPLHVAVREKNVDLAKFLLANGADVHAENNRGAMPLHVARDLSSAKLLLVSGADINARNRYGETLLHTAVGGANAQIIAVLLVNGADVNAKDSKGRTPAELASAEGTTRDSRMRAYHMDWQAYAPMAKVGVDENNIYQVGDVSPLDFENAIKTGDTDIVEKGLPSFDVSGTDPHNDGNTLLHIAARHNQPEVAQLLLDNGAGINTKNNFGNTPLHTAANSQSTEAVEFLLSRGANVNAQDNDGDTPLHQAIFHLVHTEIVKMLLSKANLNVRNKQGRRPVDLSTNEEIRRELEVTRRQHGV